MSLDLAFVRSQFPALADGFAYFDNAGGSLVLRSVADRISEYLLTTSVQTGASYEHSRRASERLMEARAKIALLVGASRPEEIVLGPSTTVLAQFLARAMEGSLEPGDEIVVTNFDHESNIGPWRALEKRGVVIKEWTIDRDSYEIDLDTLDRLMSDRTKLVAVTHASNILGTINPVKEIAQRVHERGAQIVVDAVAYAPHRAVDVKDLDVDYYIFSFYKTYGPHFAVMYGKYDRLLELDGLYHYFYGREKVPMKLEPGNTNYELAWGSAGIVDYIDKLGGGGGDRASIDRAFAGIAAHEAMIGEKLLAYLRDRNDIRIVGRRDSGADRRVPTIAFNVEGRDSAEIVRAVDKDRIGIRFGDFHSRRLIEYLGLADNNGVVRVSMVHYNTPEEVDRLIGSLDRAMS
ncbi:cysteine desulfurase family protein (TIGR01976 family) [Microvirga flocculans]|uniref:Cysteine desulfurase family protein (TIGR01976 family) n=1 Tax=Microvirga flocculans TaxID=217168 RepID=A0A7W6N8B4_9HYPH|nr:cysteine desulfurase-like protein [Microvirga flocculans]MBB4040275.1 cysteine desulfurase family protein (TIGR01976 family) [Microvirga flocculans]